MIYSGSHSYDAAGQLVGETLTPATQPVPVSAAQTFDRDNRLLTHNGAATTFDADGNLLSIASGVAPASYTYDARNRLTAAGSFGYGYNAENRRVSITDGTGTTSFVVNPNAPLDQVLVRTAPTEPRPGTSMGWVSCTRRAAPTCAIITTTEGATRWP